MQLSRLSAGLMVLATFAVPAWPSACADDRQQSLPGVAFLDVPDGGIQPQAAVDDRGAIHLVYFKGDPADGDLFYCRTDPGALGFSRPVRVNRQPGSAIAIGTIRGGQIAIGRGGRVHVAWNGSDGARPKNPAGSTPMLYARSDADGKTFEPQRNLMQRTSALDGGGTIAADRAGNVYVAWHGRTEDAAPGEAHRRMWVVRSKDDGATFSAAEPAFESPTGACGCCGTRALATQDGTVYLLYRAATRGVDRDMYLLSSGDHAGHFRGESIHPWRAEVCPMSSESLAESGGGLGVMAAWETRGQVYYSRIDPRTHRAAQPIAPEGGVGNRKHPAVAVNARGQAILVWTEGTGWQKGGSLAWQVFDRDGRRSGRRAASRAACPSGASPPSWAGRMVVSRSSRPSLLPHGPIAEERVGDAHPGELSEPSWTRRWWPSAGAFEAVHVGVRRAEGQPGDRWVLRPVSGAAEDVRAGAEGVHAEVVGADEQAGRSRPGPGPIARDQTPDRLALPFQGRSLAVPITPVERRPPAQPWPDAPTRPRPSGRPGSSGSRWRLGRSRKTLEGLSIRLVGKELLPLLAREVPSDRAFGLIEDVLDA